MKCEKCGFDIDRIKNLKLLLSELNKKVKEAEIEYETSKKLMDTVQKMDMSSDGNYKVYHNLIKEQLAKQLDALRLRTDVIQKFSPESAEILKTILNDYEQGFRNFLDVTEDKDVVPDTLKLLTGLIGVMTSVVGMSKKIDNVVKVCSYSIRDTLKRLES